MDLLMLQAEIVGATHPANRAASWLICIAQRQTFAASSVKTTVARLLH
jgi:hypothetical protein